MEVIDDNVSEEVINGFDDNNTSYDEHLAEIVNNLPLTMRPSDPHLSSFEVPKYSIRLRIDSNPLRISSPHSFDLNIQK